VVAKHASTILAGLALALVLALIGSTVAAPKAHASDGATGRDVKLASGCWRMDPDFRVWTQFGSQANSSPNDGIPTGWSRVGVPNYWDDYDHTGCTVPHYTNDRFAVDFALNYDDPIYSPFDVGRVTFAGRATRGDHLRGYGKVVSIKTPGGKYVSLSAHLSSIRTGLNRGDWVDRDTLIGFAGDSGGSDIPVEKIHLHQAFYRYPKFHADGTPYGGAGLQVTRYHHVGDGGGVYRFGWERTTTVKAQGSLVSY
jgi:murein DD-endopeptidase MepM/ murein hydrolase activator NlpD